jgi:hypothetical protein
MYRLTLRQGCGRVVSKNGVVECGIREPSYAARKRYDGVASSGFYGHIQHEPGAVGCKFSGYSWFTASIPLPVPTSLSRMKSIRNGNGTCQARSQLVNSQLRFPSLASYEIMARQERDYRYCLILAKTTWVGILKVWPRSKRGTASKMQPPHTVRNRQSIH